MSGAAGNRLAGSSNPSAPSPIRFPAAAHTGAKPMSTSAGPVRGSAPVRLNSSSSQQGMWCPYLTPIYI